MQINELVTISHGEAKKSGWYADGTRPIPELLCLIHSELSECLESYRKNEPLLWYRRDGKPEGLLSELADVIIRTMDFVGLLHEQNPMLKIYNSNEPDAESYFMPLNFEQIILDKIEFNKTRGLRHGGKKC